MSLLNKYGILGINARNLLYIRPYNRKKAIRFADSKLKTKQFLSARDIPVPKLYASIKKAEELEKFDFGNLPERFVLKPNLGFGGEGIIPIIGRKDGEFVKISGDTISLEQMQNHIRDIIDGQYSISGMGDTAFFEQLVICDERIGKFSYGGLPDIRVIVHNLIPVMAMLRLPTRESDGKANLHQGAIGAGIDIAKGEVTHIAKGRNIIDEVPEAGEIRGLKIPYWEDILQIASKAQLITNLGFMAADIAIDKNSGPVLLEINARAGLGVQIANLAPLRARLERIEGIHVPTPEKGVRIAQDIFGHKIEREIKHVSGKEVIGDAEDVEIITKEGTFKTTARINPIVDSTFIDLDFAKSLELALEEDLGEKIKLKLNLAGTRLQTVAELDDLSNKDYKVVVGKRDLGHFLIDPAKKKPTLPEEAKEKIEEGSKINYKNIDDQIEAIDKQIKLLYHLKPVNIDEEKEKFFIDDNYNPQFKYPNLKFDPQRIKEKLKAIELDDSPLSLLFQKKIDEIAMKVNILENRGTSKFTEASIELYGKPSTELLKNADDLLKELPEKFEEGEDEYSARDAIDLFEKVFREYRLEKWKVKEKETMVADCIAGKSNVLFVRHGAEFSKERLDMLVAHEIETHILTAANGALQPYKIFNRGFANYLETQEGLAIYNQQEVVTKEVAKKYRPALLVKVIDHAISKSFRELYNLLVEYGLSNERAFRTVLKVKRGLEDTSEPGAFTKDLVYFKGYQQVLEYIDKGGNLTDLYIGKMNIDDLEIVKSIPGIVPPKYLPPWL